MSEIKKIAIIVIIVFILLVIINIKGINLNEPKPESKLVQQVVVETFDTSLTNTSLTNTSLTDTSLTTSNSFCQSHLGNSMELEQSCNQLTETNCNNVKCCVYTMDKNSNGKCVAGNIHGPTYKTDKDGKWITMDAYYYLGKRH